MPLVTLREKKAAVARIIAGLSTEAAEGKRL